MAKNRALRKNGTVGKLLWCSDRDAQLLETMAAVMEEVCESDLALTQ